MRGAIDNYMAATLDFVGLQYISASFVSLILYLYPAMVVMLSAPLLRRRHAGIFAGCGRRWAA